jgi:Transport and Golgi organisation 2
VCTVTVVPWRGRVRLAANRDERRSRPAALPPEVRSFGERRAVLPVDPVGGGTWVAVNDAGLAMALLNVSAGWAVAETAAPTKSRGAIIPALLCWDTLSRATERALRLDAAEYAPFRLVLVDRTEFVEIRSDRKRLRPVSQGALAAPRLFTSSGLGDRLVQGPRAGLFTRFFGPSADWVAAQDAYHRHRWPDRGHLSVCMHRADACTVSHTVVTLGPDRVSLVYSAGPPDDPLEVFVTDLVRRAGGVS